MDKLSRREVLENLGKSIVVGMFAGANSAASYAEMTKKLLQLPEVNLENPKDPSFDVFFRLSQWVTCRRELDKAIAQKMFPLFQAEPWGKNHLASTYEKLQTKLRHRNEEGSILEMMNTEVLGEGEVWFASHILTTWYLGIYYHESREPVRVTYEGALVWQALDGWTNPPGFTTLEPGHWSKEPTGVATKL